MHNLCTVFHSIATVPFRIPNSTQQPAIQYGKKLWDDVSAYSVYVPVYLVIWFLLLIWYQLLSDVASEIAEGGMYIGPEFQLGQVYDGSVENGDSVVLYRPVYVSVTSQGK